jgi:hypothetical protein
MTRPLTDPAALELIEADAENLFYEVCAEEGLDEKWEEVPAPHRAIFLYLARNPYRWRTVG